MRSTFCRRFFPIPVVMLTLFGISSSVDAQPRSRGQRVILAFEAARADAYRNLLESVQGLRVDGETTVQNLAVESSETRTQLEEFIRGATIVDEGIESDGAARVTLELDLDRLERLLGRNLPDGVRRIRVDGFGAPPSPVAAGRPAAGRPAASQPVAGQPAVGQPAAGQPAAGQPAAGVQSAVVGSPFAWNQEPDAPPAIISSTVTVTGSAAQDLGRVRSAAQARLLAERAAVNDGYRRLLEYVYGISVSSTTTVRDLVLSSDRLDSEVSGFIRGAQVVEVRHRPDGIAEADLSLDLSDLQRIINW